MYEISKLDVNRIYRYLDKYTEKIDPGSIPTSNASIVGGCGKGATYVENDTDWGDTM
jgi:hypothetical protein